MMDNNMGRIGAKIDYGWIDVCKFFFCLCVIGIHTGIDSVFSGGWLINRFVFRQAVPFFFTCSGFFVGKKIFEGSKDIYLIVIKYCKRMALPLLLFSIINVIQQIISMLVTKLSVYEICHQVIVHVLFYPYGALWYMQACIVGILLLFPFLKFNKINLALAIGFLLYLFALLCNSYFFVGQIWKIDSFIQAYIDIFLSARNGVFVGFFMLALGIKCAQIYNHINNSIYIIFFIAFFACFAESLFLTYNITAADDGALLLSHVIVSPCLLLVLIKMQSWILPCSTKLFRNLSVGMYLLHRPVMWCITWFTDNVVVLFVIVVVISLLVCLLAYKSKKKFLMTLLR